MNHATPQNQAGTDCFYIFHQNLVLGPYSREELARQLAAGAITPETPVSAGADSPWLPLKSLSLPPPPKTGGTSGTRSFSAPGAEEEIPEGDIICPHCWLKFDSEYLLYIASHPSLTGDPVLGAGEQKRFAPTSFNAAGLALDEMNAPCSEMACPRCHLPIPAAVIENPSYCCSLVGAPSSGKTYYLATLLHRLRQVLPEKFSRSLLDADPRLNAMLNEYESTIFRARDRNKVAILKKTEMEGGAFCDTVFLNNLSIQLPKPFIYELRKQHGPDTGTSLVFYDNGGEHFQPGMDDLHRPGTRHLGCSDGIIFLFDPLNDAAMRSACSSGDPQLETTHQIVDQTVLMAEMIGRIRRHRNLSAADRCDIPLVVAVGKYDGWKNIFEKDLARSNPVRETMDSLEGALDLEVLMDVSFALRELLTVHVPELVQTAESFFTDVTFVPFSSFGVPARRSEAGDRQIGILPREIAPVWAEVPFLLLLTRAGLLPGSAPEPAKAQTLGQVMDDFVVFRHPAAGRKTRLPANYGGAVLTIDGKRYLLPETGFSRGRLRGKNTAGDGDDLWS